MRFHHVAHIECMFRSLHGVESHLLAGKVEPHFLEQHASAGSQSVTFETVRGDMSREVEPEAYLSVSLPLPGSCNDTDSCTSSASVSTTRQWRPSSVHGHRDRANLSSSSWRPPSAPACETLLPVHSTRKRLSYHDASLTSNEDEQDPTAKRVDRILEFLKGVEEDDAKSAASMRDMGSVGSPAGVTLTPEFAMQGNYLPSTASLPSSGSTTAVFDGVKAKIIGQQLEIEEKTRTVEMFKKEVKRLKENLKDQATESKKELKSKLALQRKEYETIIKRHLTFIDKLLAEKEELSKKCEALTEEVMKLEKQFRVKSEALEEQHEKDLKQQKQMWEAAEKIKRDKWIQEKTKAIKEQTVKGLEPEIQRMLAQQKFQIRQMEEKFREDLAREKNVLVEQQQRQMDTMRDRITAERQRACEEEREFARQRYQKQLERDEMEFQQQKRKLMADFDEQKHILTESFKLDKQQDEISYRKQLDDLRRQVDAAQVAKEQVLADLQRRHQTELSQQRERLDIEKEEWQRQYIARHETEMRNREKVFKEKLIRERDAELEMVIQRLESETSSNSSEVSRRYRMEIEKLKAEAAEQVKQLRDQHSLAIDKLLAAQNDLRAIEDAKRNVEKQLLQCQHEASAKENLIRQQKSELARLQLDESTLAQSIRGEFENQLESKDATLRTFAEQISQHEEQIQSLERKHHCEVEAIVKEKNHTVGMIEEGVRKALAVKDELLTNLRTQVEDLSIKNTHLERLIEKQRQELLS
ncbi:hypothetical protein BC832DRAFT_10359 [Gaertneriomyces semiglobifer]|nr:hypothetical protein BC832DRAFT_10359 [Gaertneriomyces semiglobifer]